jgi:multiple sugar transport system substrate-binding protein
MLRRLVIVIAVCVCLAPLAFGAGGQEKASTGPVKLTWFAPMSAGPELDLWKLQLLPDFQKLHPNITVEHSVEVWADYWQKIAVMFAGGQFPDLVWMHYTRFKDYAQQGMLQPLDDVMSKDKGFNVADYAPQMMDIFKHKGKQYVMPKDHGGTAVWYNIDMLEGAGMKLPWQGWKWSDFLEIATKMTKDTNGDGQTDVWGTNDIFLGGDPASWWHAEAGWDVLKSFGGETYSDDFKTAFIDKPETVEAIQFMADVLNKHKIAPKSEQIAGLGDPFRIGKVALHGFPHANQGFFVRYEKRPIKRYGIEFVPAGKGGTFYGLGATGFAIPTKSQHPKEAWELTKFGVSKETGEKVAQHYRWGAIRKDQWALRFELQEKAGITIEENWRRVWVDSVFKPKELGVTVGNALVPAGLWEINTILKTEFDPVYLGKRTAQEAAAAAKPKIQAVLAKNYK